ncbi:MAG: PBSX family phage terminase large subunit [Pseudomonadota bacterium]
MELEALPPDLPLAKIPAAFRELFQPHRYKVFYGGRGGAKSWAFADALLILGAQKSLRILCARELQKSIKDSVHKLLADRIVALGLSDVYDVLSTEIRGTNGTEFIFEGIKTDPHKIKSKEGIDICWVEEAEKVSSASWKFLIPTIRKPGSEIWVSFNPSSKHDATWQRFIVNTPPNAYVRKVGYQDNPYFPQVLRDEMEHDRSVDAETAQNTWDGELRDIAEGAVFKDQIVKARADGRFCRIPIASGIPVNTFWDLGRSDDTAIWFHQKIGPEHRFIDYYSNRLKDIEHYVKAMQDKGYIWGTHYLPHDAGHMRLGVKRSNGEQGSMEDLINDAGLKNTVIVSRCVNKGTDIDYLRREMGSMWFDEERCERGLEALKHYVYKHNEENDVLSVTPLHNWASNGADALMQFRGYREIDDAFEQDLEIDTSWVV